MVGGEGILPFEKEDFLMQCSGKSEQGAGPFPERDGTSQLTPAPSECEKHTQTNTCSSGWQQQMPVTDFQVILLCLRLLSDL